MKKRLAALVLALLFLSEQVTAYDSMYGERTQPPGQSFAISAHGTLLELFDGNGRSRFGKLARDGFAVSYQIRGKTAFASAIGTRRSGLQHGQVNLNGQITTAIVKTNDNALEITSYFIFDERAKKLIIGRRFRNISARPMTLRMMRGYVDPTLVVGEQPLSNRSVNLVQLALERIRAGRENPMTDCGGHPSECRPCDCPPPPPCPGIICSGLNNLAPAQLLGGQRDVILQWQKVIKLAPFHLRSNPGEATHLLPGNETFIVTQVSLR